MATSSFTRKIVVIGKEAVDTIIDALVSDTPKKTRRKFVEERVN